MTDGEHIGARLRRWRLRRGQSQRVLGELAGFSQGYVAQIEKGLARLDRRSSLEAFARALQIPIGELTRSAGNASWYEPVGPRELAALRSGVFALFRPELVIAEDREDVLAGRTPSHDGA